MIEDASEGSSIAVNGVCLTVVNLEGAAAIGDRLSGHIVQRYVDGTGEFVALNALPDGNLAGQDAGGTCLERGLMSRWI